MADDLLYPIYAPDLTDIGTGTGQVMSGVVPQIDGYGPFKSLVEFTAALPARCRGYSFARRSDGSIAVFAGTVDRLYLLDNTTLQWVDMSNGGVAYPALVGTDNWEFRQFNDLVLAVQRNTPPQKFALATATEFEDLGGSPPAASHIAIVNRFVVLTGLLSNPRRVAWCDLDAPEVWTAGIGLADFQDLPDGGSCFAISGGDAYGLVFQDSAIRSLIYAPGSPVTFQIVRISTEDTLFAQYSVINAGTRTFFCSAQGFKVVEAGGMPQPIGIGMVDKTFQKDVDRGNLQLMISATDPTATRVYWAYKSRGGNEGLFDKVLSYDWSTKPGKWSLLPLSGAFLAGLAKPGLTLENLDALAPTPLVITGAANNGSGAVRLTMPALANADFTIVGQNFIVVYGVEGTTEANGTWRFTIIDPTHIDLIDSTFANAYTAGGQIGGSLDALGFSLDSISVAAIAELSAFSANNKLGFFNGPNIEAVMETTTEDLKGRLVFVQGARPLTDCTNVKLSLGCRETAQEAIAYTAEKTMDARGYVTIMRETRYVRARVRHPAGSTWTYARGIQPDAILAGEQ